MHSLTDHSTAMCHIDQHDRVELESQNVDDTHGDGVMDPAFADPEGD